MLQLKSIPSCLALGKYRKHLEPLLCSLHNYLRFPILFVFYLLIHLFRVLSKFFIPLSHYGVQKQSQ